ncbi:hypothetical protein HG531_000802 [Fusarium graminearum]|nr:hypothetical protein HG531_000802 [Fusarium graminearum]
MLGAQPRDEIGRGKADKIIFANSVFGIGLVKCLFGVVRENEVKHAGAHLRNDLAIRKDELWCVGLDMSLTQADCSLVQGTVESCDFVFDSELFEKPQDCLCAWRVLEWALAYAICL